MIYSKKFTYKSTSQLLAKFTFLLLLGSLTACLSVPNHSINQEWTQKIIAYKHTLDDVHPDSTESVLKLDNRLKQSIVERFQSNAPKNIIANNLAKWLISEDGHGMVYDVDANLNPMQAYQQKRGNCLSFTLLYVALAAELGIDIEFNMVDLPNMWGSNNENEYVLYRHINAILRTNNGYQIYDLANELYDFAYPQRIIPHEHALAQLHSNKAIANLEQGNSDDALHFIKLAISLSPINEDLWVNLGVILNRHGDQNHAEQALLYAYSLNSQSEVAASAIERLYTMTNQTEQAKKYRAAALRARQSNPYYLYQLAQTFYQDGEYKKARSEIKKAIRAHNEDPKFHELYALIAQHLGKHGLALRHVLIAYQLSHEVDEQIRYAHKAKMISKITTQREIENGFRSKGSLNTTYSVEGILEY